MEEYFTQKLESLNLKELGFDEPCLAWRYEGSEDIRYNVSLSTRDKNFRKNSDFDYFNERVKITAPTYSQAFEFFRRKGYDSEILRSPIDNTLYGKKYDYNIWINNETEHGTSYEYDTYEEAKIACLKKLILIEKENGKPQN